VIVLGTVELMVVLGTLELVVSTLFLQCNMLSLIARTAVQMAAVPYRIQGFLT